MSCTLTNHKQWVSEKWTIENIDSTHIGDAPKIVLNLNYGNSYSNNFQAIDPVFGQIPAQQGLLLGLNWGCLVYIIAQGRWWVDRDKHWLPGFVRSLKMLAGIDA